jgi:hypothetical protein
MKVLKGQDTAAPKVKHPRDEGGSALRAGIKQLKENHAECAREMPKRPEHRRK